MTKNSEKYLKTNPTPFTTGQQWQELGYDRSTQAGEEILQGSYNHSQKQDNIQEN